MSDLRIGIPSREYNSDLVDQFSCQANEYYRRYHRRSPIWTQRRSLGVDRYRVQGHGGVRPFGVVPRVLGRLFRWQAFRCGMSLDSHHDLTDLRSVGHSRLSPNLQRGRVGGIGTKQTTDSPSSAVGSPTISKCTIECKKCELVNRNKPCIQSCTDSFLIARMRSTKHLQTSK